MGSSYTCSLLVLLVVSSAFVEKTGCNYDTNYGSDDTDDTDYGTYSRTSSTSRRKRSNLYMNI